ncbi:MAG: STAS domain-containing protein [Methanolinea sp.]|jgi:anti-anti-sigma factor|nr:STAS domain-containing protein [Methanolinea sp.]
MSTNLQVAEQRRGDTPVLSLKGRMDATTSPDAEVQLTRLIEGGDRHIVVDLSELEYISSAGLRVLLAGLKRLKQCGGAMKLAALRPEIQKVFDIAGFNRLFAIYPTLEEALGGGQAG